MSPASTVLPRPTSSAISRLTRGMRRASTSGSELVVLDVDASPEGRLEGARVGRGDRSPPRGVEEGSERIGVVDPCRRVRQLGLRAHLGAGLGLPEDGERVWAALVVDRDEVDAVVLDRASRARRVERQGGGADRLDDPVAIADANEVALLRYSYCPLALDQRHGATLDRPRRTLSDAWSFFRRSRPTPRGRQRV